MAESAGPDMLPHGPDPDEITPTNPLTLAYAEQVGAWGRATPEPDLQLSYGPDRGQRLDIYAPPGADKLPILLFFHGGAWISGHLGWLRFMAPIVTALPAVFVAGSYRLAPRCRWPGPYEDVGQALRFVVDHAESWGGDPHRIVIGGHSAGGHLASLLTLRERSPVAACMPVSSSFDLQYGDVPLGSDAGRVYLYLFAERNQDFEASPLNFVSGNRTPFHIVWGEADFERVATSSAAMIEALQAEGSPVSHRVLPGASHFDTHLALSDPADPWYARLREAFATAGATA
ncbi:MAG: alpha/beta hydrolase [Allosphingosinicella sp.]